MGVKQFEHGDDNSSPSSARVKHEWSCFSVAPYTCMVYTGTT